MLNLKALEGFEIGNEAKAIREAWVEGYPDDPMKGFTDDLEKVVNAFQAAAQLPARLKYDPVKLDEVNAEFATRNGTLKADEPFDPRAMIAVAGQIGRQPPVGGPEPFWARIQNQIVASREPGILDGAFEQKVAEVRLKTNELADLIFAEVDTVDEPD